MKTYFKYEGLIKSKEEAEAIAAPVASAASLDLIKPSYLKYVFIVIVFRLFIIL